MGRHVEDIKACLGWKKCILINLRFGINVDYRGPPDPLRGDEPYRKVREAAREALDSIFESTAYNNSSSSSIQSQTRNRIQVFDHFRHLLNGLILFYGR